MSLDTKNVPVMAAPENVPALSSERRLVHPVAPRVAVQLVPPESATLGRLRNAIPRTLLVPMPETTVNEDHLSPRAEYEVGAAREVLRVKTVAIPQAVDEPPNSDLGFRILGPDSAHPLASLASRKRVETTSFHGEL